MNATKTMLSKRNVLDGLKAVRTVEVDVPELGGVLRIRELTALEAREFSDAAKKADGALRLMVLCAIDESGAQLFGEDDLPELNKLGMAVIMRVQRAALKLNGLADDEKETAAVKNA